MKAIKETAKAVNDNRLGGGRIVGLLMAVAFAAGIELPMFADSLVTPVAATAQSHFARRAPMNAIDGSGMSSNPVTAGSTASTVADLCTWLSNGTKETWIMFDMGEAMTLTGLRVWNYNEVNSGYYRRGVKTCELRYGGTALADGATYASAGAWGTLAETLTLASSSGMGTAPAEGEDILFSAPITARYVTLRVLDNYGKDNYTGLGEVRFYSRTPPKRRHVTGESSKNAYTVRDNDLLQTAVVSTNDALVIKTADNDRYSKGTTASLTDGTFGAAGYADGLCIQGGTVTYDLDTAAVPGGYDISDVHVYTGWTSGRENPLFVLSCRHVGETDFRPVGSFSYICEITDGTPRNTHLALVDLDLAGVAAIRFDFGDGAMQQSTGVGYKEIDVVRGIRGAKATVSPVAATSESSWRTRGPANVIDGVELSPARWPQGRNVTMSSNAGNMWLSDGHKPTWIAFDLGSVRQVKGFHLWNYNEKAENGTDYSPRGIKTAGVYVGGSMPAQGGAYSAAGAAWGTLVQEMTFAKGTAAASYGGEDYFFDTPATGRYFQLAISANHGTENHTGISEIVFYCDADETEVTRGSSGAKMIADSLTGIATIRDGEGTAAPVTVASATTRLHTLRGETYDGAAQIDAAGKTLALGKIELPEGTVGLEILSGSTLVGVEGQRHWMEWTLDADLVIHGAIADGAASTSFAKTGTGTVTIDGTDTHQGETYYTDGGYRQTGGTVDTRGATFTRVACELVGGMSRATQGVAVRESAVSVSGPHAADWRYISGGGFSSLAVTNGGVMKVGWFSGNPYDFSIVLDGGTLGTSALGAATPWLPALGTVTVGAGGATLDTSATGAVVEAGIAAPGVAIRKTGAYALALRRRVAGASRVDVAGGTLALSLPAPIVHYDFNSISGTTVPNLGTGGAALDGVISGSPATVAGVDGNALLFSTNDQGVATAGGVTLRQYTYAAWVKSAGPYDKAQRIVIGGAYSTASFLGYLGTNSDKYWAFARNLGDLSAEIASDDTENWHHLATTYDGETVTLYVDGVAAQTKALAHNRSALTVKIGFGNNVTPNAEHWNGAIDEAYVFDRALSADEVAMLRDGSWRAVDVLDPDTELNVAAGATLDLGGTDQTVATFSIGGLLKCYGETTWGAVGSGAAHETPRITGGGVLRVKGPAPRGTIIIFN